MRFVTIKVKPNEADAFLGLTFGCCLVNVGEVL